MPDQVPPPRRRPTSGAAASEGRPVRRTGVQRAVAAPGARLVCTAGPRAGTEFPLEGAGELIVGRATDNAISIPDTSVSRRHCSLRRGPEGWCIVDLGSGNGTLINGEPIEAEAVLRNGDVVTIGDTELTFANAAETTAPRASLPVRSSRVDAPARPRPVPSRPDARARISRAVAPVEDAAAKARKRKLLLIGAAGAVVVLGGLVIAKVKVDQRDAAIVAQQQQELQRRAALGAIFQEGKNLVRDGKWADARVKFEEMLAQAPEYPGVKDYLDRANIEIPNQQQLAAAETALEKNQLAAASEALGKVTPDTQQFEKLRGLEASLDRKLGERLAEANAAMSASDFEKALAITDDLLKARPDNRDAGVVNENARKAIALRDAPPPTPQKAPARPWLEVIQRYVDGDMSGALALADQCASGAPKCRTLASQIRQFAELYKKVESLDANGLAKLLALDQEISDGARSKMARAAGVRAAGMFYKNASAAKTAGQWGRALEWAKKTLQADPTHSGAKSLVEDGRKKAHDVYMSGYLLKDTSPDEAVGRFREVLLMTSPDDEDYQKAKNWIEKLQR